MALGYLRGGWYTRVGTRRLREEVVNGAIDSAGLLHREGLRAGPVCRLAQAVRALATAVDPPHRQGQGAALTARERAALRARLTQLAAESPALGRFVDACAQHIRAGYELRALAQHLLHISQMLQLLAVAAVSRAEVPWEGPDRAARRAGTGC